jgi:hypothetical protein
MFQNSRGIQTLPCLKASDSRSLPMNDAARPDRFLARCSKLSGARDFRWLETVDRVAVVSWAQPRRALPTIGSGICRVPRNRTSYRRTLWRSPYTARPSLPMRNGVPGQTKHRARLCAFSVGLWVACCDQQGIGRRAIERLGRLFGTVRGYFEAQLAEIDGSDHHAWVPSLSARTKGDLPPHPFSW